MLIRGLAVVVVGIREGSEDESNWVCSGGGGGGEALIAKNRWKKDILLQDAERWERQGA